MSYIIQNMSSKVQSKKTRSMLYQHNTTGSCGVGCIANTKGFASYGLVEDALTILSSFKHRSSFGADPFIGDGAGLMLPIPHEILQKTAGTLPEPGHYAVCMMFIKKKQTEVINFFGQYAKKFNLSVRLTRQVPINRIFLGDAIKLSCPNIVQIICEPIGNGQISEHQLYQLKHLFQLAIAKQFSSHSIAHIASLSSKTVIYKALSLPQNLGNFYLDLQNTDFQASFAIAHSRFTTNTVPDWSLIQPCQMLSHNGEFNSLKSNINSIKTLKSLYSTKKHGSTDLFNLDPSIVSDSMCLDQWVEYLYYAGLSLEVIFSILLAPTNQQLKFYSPTVQAFYRYYSAQISPWGGSAAVIFSDGNSIGACLDRCGPRSLRVQHFSDHTTVISSEIGGLRRPSHSIIEDTCISAGQMILLDLKSSSIRQNNNLKNSMASSHNFMDIIHRKHVDLPTWKTIDDIKPKALSKIGKITSDQLIRQQRAAGYTNDTITQIFEPMVNEAKIPLSNNKTPKLAIFSDQAMPFFNYFHQRSAQITYPSIDPIRERGSLSLRTFFGKRHNIFSDPSKQPAIYHYNHSILTPDAFYMITSKKGNDFMSKIIHGVCKRRLFKYNLKKRLAIICNRSEKAIKKGARHIVISDDSHNKHDYAIPSALLCSAVHQHLVKKKRRHEVSLIMAVGDVFTHHHVSTLFALGADAVYPYLAYKTIREGCKMGGFNQTFDVGIYNYVSAMDAGLLQILSSLGCPTLRGFIGSQNIDIMGLSDFVLATYFNIPLSLIGGLTLDVIQKERLMLHRMGFKPKKVKPLFGVKPDENSQFCNSVQIRDLFTIIYPEEDPANIIIPLDSILPFMLRKPSVGSDGDLDNQFKQISSDRFKISADYLISANMIQIDSAPHHDVYSIEDLKQLIFDLKSINPKALINVKLISESGVGAIAVGVAKANADIITIASDHRGLPWEVGLVEVHQALVVNQFRQQVALQVEGDLTCTKDVLIAAILGANYFDFSLIPMDGNMIFSDWINELASDVQLHLLRLQVKTLAELIGRTDLIQWSVNKRHWKANELNFSPFFFDDNSSHDLLTKPIPATTIDHRIMDDISRKTVSKSYSITNMDLSIGASLSYLSKQDNFPKKKTKIQVKFNGYAGQSFGSFLTSAFKFHCVGGANDCVGKSLSGGEIVIQADPSINRSELLIGNSSFYAATSGKGFIAGKAGDRFAVRNSGATLVVEGMGNHGCEDMTDGTVLCLDEVGINFGSGMRGGNSYVYYDQSKLLKLINSDDVMILDLDKSDEAKVLKLLKNHVKATNSQRATEIFKGWDTKKTGFYKVLPLA